MRRSLQRVGSPLLALSLSAAGALADTTAVPAIVAVVLDTSGSLAPRDLTLTRELALGTLEVLPAGSQIALFTFDDESRLILPRTSDPQALRQALSQVAISGRFTALHDALYDASRYLRDVPAERRAVLLLTDGKDENSALKLEDGLSVAREHVIPVLAVGVGRRVQERSLRRIAKLTSGHYVSADAATAAGIAAAILELPPRALDAPAPAISPSPRPAPQRSDELEPPPRFRTDLLLLWGILSLGLVLSAGALVLRLRSRRAARCPACGRELRGPEEPCPDCEVRHQHEAAAESSAGDGFETLLSRVDELGQLAGGTVVLTTSPTLTIRNGPSAGAVFNLAQTSAMSIGRGPGNEIVLPDEAVSSQHCRIRPEAGRFVVHDLESTNGTFVNERRVTRHMLSEGDVIRLGETWLEFGLYGGKG